MSASQAYLNKNVHSLMEDDPGRAYRSLKKLAARPGDCTDEGSFTLSSHVDENLPSVESTERMAEHFVKISQEYPPLNPELLSPHVKMKIDNPGCPEELPRIEDYQVYNNIKKSKKPRSSVPGDLPRRLVREFAPELAAPAAKIFKNILKTGEWPKTWRTEYGVPLQKQDNPANEDQLRIISLTSFFSKQFEKFVITWLLEYVGDQLDWGQYGGVRGSSISHYLVDFVNFILYNHDLAVPHAVLAAMVDFSKAFNRINHNTIITILSEMGVPGWLLRIVMGFLTERELIVRYKGGLSGRKALPGGGPQGTRLGLFLFLILVNAAGFPHLEKYLGKKITGTLNKRSPIPNIHMKYVDDISLAQSLNMKNCVIDNPDPSPTLPLTYHDRTGHILPTTQLPLQLQLDRLVELCKTQDMVINTGKSKVMIFNPSRNFDSTPKLTLPDMGGEYLEVVESVKLLGVVMRSDMRWCDNTDYICQKGYSRLWMIRRLKGLGATSKELLDVYQKQVRVVLELAVPVWHPAITIEERKQIERVQKCALYIILGSDYTCYSNALETLGIESLENRRSKICESFAMKCYKSPRYHTWFHANDYSQSQHYTRAYKSKLRPVSCRTKRYKNSALPYLTESLNNILSKKK